ncbi:UDP-2,3-diacylglucosamine hydrolase [Andreprevotia lacus DSM 23236]|jgi:UDP-2,3-diacylglucosamine hydrolase|uniref:UDP-2,3-diacylglucosamine hydrolase n=1 Tax=Andreprevotia lacus DSM 23236 TaxID=1121001 RepID=A0A1W1XXW4_9NEIS|nr:UDP-2,3-diacylglucosamine diphosphatase [Andreprevotia lacus]SMC28766.1 UDP-2,3-diacylglucosamine hydrolase [Andreprevotia lacus DSM 23236]
MTTTPRPILFIADLHLSPADPATLAALHAFLAGTARAAAVLYILGDLFEVWIGDDQLAEPAYADIAASLRGLADSGVPVYLMPGNRDFLVGKRLARAAGLTLLPDPTVITPFGLPLLLAHGDAYCTDDAAYQRFRRIVRNPLTQWLWRRLPFALRNREAAKLRRQSQAHNRQKAAYIMDVNAAAVEHAMRTAASQTLIHGHTHRPAQHAHATGTRWVLPDWHAGQGGYLQLDADGISMHQLDGSPFVLPA